MKSTFPCSTTIVIHLNSIMNLSIEIISFIPVFDVWLKGNISSTFKLSSSKGLTLLSMFIQSPDDRVSGYNDIFVPRHKFKVLCMCEGILHTAVIAPLELTDEKQPSSFKLLSSRKFTIHYTLGSVAFACLLGAF